MAKSETYKLRRRAERAEAMVIDMGFLLLKLRKRFGSEFGVGIDEQVSQAICNYRELERVSQLRAETTQL